MVLNQRIIEIIEELTEIAHALPVLQCHRNGRYLWNAIMQGCHLPWGLETTLKYIVLN
jgi:hypothetical protein